MQVEIISIGNELLNGRTVNTNASFIAEKLFETGINVRQVVTVRDESEAISGALREALGHSDAVLMTGGLGPTHDDITNKVVADFFNSPLVFKEEILLEIKSRFKRRGLAMPAINRSMAYIPEKATLLPNPIGTAPGMIFEQERKLVFVLPGVPQEMRAIMEHSIVPILREKCPTCQIQVNTFRTTGIAESSILQKISDGLKQCESYEIAFLPKYSGVDLRVTRRSGDIADEEKFNSFKKLLYRKIGDYIYTTRKEELEAVVGRLLREKNWTISVAESLTGGLVQHKITNVAGSSEYFLGGVVAYSNESKINLLGVERELLRNYGAVSEPVAREMALGIRSKFGADIGVSTTGIAGPSGATATKPVGLVYIGLVTPQEVFVKKIQFGKDRFFNKQRSAQAALDTVRRTILGIKS